MQDKEHLKKFRFNWETLDIIANGASSIDAKNYLANFNNINEVKAFIEGYGFNIDDPIENAEMFGNFQEALQFIKKYFLKEGNIEDGIDLSIPNVFYTLTDVSELMLIATGNSNLTQNQEDILWASAILKVMHTILHLDKDLRSRYYTTIQTQIFDRFYKYLHREGDKLFIRGEDESETIPLVEFETKSTKTRDSIIIKLLHKKENVAEELFDRIGIRLITHNKLDCVRLLRLLYKNHIVVVNNIKPSRSQNTLIDLDKLKKKHYDLVKENIKSEFSEEVYTEALRKAAEECELEKPEYKNNKHTSRSYRAIHFTCRQLIKYKNPFYLEFIKVKRLARKDFKNSALTKKISELDTSSIAKDVRFFYPYEIQITDKESHLSNTKGEASHSEYKRSQLKSALRRILRDLAVLKEIDLA